MPNISPNTSIWPNYASHNTKAVKEHTSTLGQNEFLQILIAQLRHQDPLQPMQDRDFIAQMAQFSSVEQMMNMAEEVKLLRQSMGISSDLIGKNVSWYEINSSETGLVSMSGVVEAITFNQGSQFVVVSGKMIPIDDLIKVWVGEEPVLDGEESEPVLDDEESESVVEGDQS